jgi:hypothetical protein
MRRQLFINLGLAALVLLLVLAVWLSNREAPPPEKTPVTNLDPAAIGSIRIRNSSGEFLLERRESGWRMSYPYVVAANDARVAKLLQIAGADSLESFPAPAEGLAEFGLEPPQAVLDLGSTRIEMGSTNPINHHRYLRIGDTLHLIRDRFPHHLLAGAEGFVSLRLIPAGGSITAIRTPDWRLSRGEDGELLLDPPLPELSVDDLQLKLQRWQQAHAARALPLAKERATPDLELILEDEEHPLRFLIVREKNRVLLLRQELGLAFRLPTGSDLLDPPAAQD